MENRRLIHVVGEDKPEENKYVGTRDELDYFRVRVLDEDRREFYYNEAHYRATCKRLPKHQRDSFQYDDEYDLVNPGDHRIGLDRDDYAYMSVSWTTFMHVF